MPTGTTQPQRFECKMKTGRKKNNQDTDGNNPKHGNGLSDDTLTLLFQKYNEQNKETGFCEKTDIAIAYARNELTGKEKENAKSHILKCKACLDMVLDVRAAEAQAVAKKENGLQMPPAVAAAMNPSGGLRGLVFFKRIRDLIKSLASPPFRNHKLVAGFATAALVLCVASFGLHNRFSSVSVQIGIIATAGHSVPEETGTVRGSDGESDPSRIPETYVLKPGGVLRTGDYFKIKIQTSKKAYVYLLLHNEAGNTISSIYSAMMEAGKDKTVPQEEYGIQLGPYTGVKTIFMIVAKKEIKDFDQKISLIKKNAALDNIRNVFPNTHVERFSFHHEPED